MYATASADHMDLSAALARSQYQATLAERASAWPGWQAEAPAPLCWRRTCRRLGLALSPSSPARGRVGHARPLRPPRSGFHDVVGAAVGHELEVLDETRGQGVVLVVVIRTARPSVGGIENPRRNAGALGGNVEAEHRVGLEGYVMQLAREGRVQERARVLDADALADAERAARPAGIHQPAGGSRLQQTRFQHVRVGVGAVHHERAA